MSDWRIGVDIGGTFTDIVLWDSGGGQLIIDKVLTTPDDPSRAVLAGIRQVLGTADIQARDLGAVIHGTTLVANALIERKGVKTGLITTEGFRDVLEIGREWRYDLFDLDIAMPAPLVPRPLRQEARERVGPDGSVVTPLDIEALRPVIAGLKDAGVEALAVCLLHSYVNPAHEQAIAGLLAEEWPEVALSLSSSVSPELGEYERSSTTAANAYIHPVFRGYVDRLVEALEELGFTRELLLVLSDGRCVRAGVATRYPIRLVQSGPAAGAEAARLFGELAGVDDVLCFDMGGTTAKACLIPDGQPERTVHFEVARETRFAEGSGLPLQIPAIDMIEIGAGGGSIARVDQRGLLQVGPDSAGASPGPVCYGAGNQQPTVTDCDLVLGYLGADSFLGGRMRLDKQAAENAIAEHLAKPLGISVAEAAWGVHETVTANMAQAATIHAIERALDVTRFVMLPIGGAGPVHACGMAAKMNIDTLICPTGAGVASAVGMLSSAISFEVARAAPMAAKSLDFERLGAMITEMDAEASDLVTSAGVAAETVTRRLSAMMRYVGQGYEIEAVLAPEVIHTGDKAALLEAFNEAYRRRYGRNEDMPVEILTWRLAVEGPRSGLGQSLLARASGTGASPKPIGHRPAWFGDGFVETPIHRRADLPSGATIAGPAIIEEVESTTIVPPDFDLSVDRALNLVLTRASPTGKGK
jgi:N-methylhydantoinase A